MTAYNVVNGVHASENAELIQGILRRDWGYDGLVATDWDNTANRCREVKAGNDIRMPYTTDWSNPKPFIGTFTNANTRSELAICVKRLLELILWLE